MRRLPGQAFRLGVSLDAVSLLRTSRWTGERVAPVAEQPLDGHGPEALAAALRALLQGRDVAGWPVSIVLADEWCRLWQVTPPPQATRLADIEAACALRFHALYGESPAAWQITADWHAEAPFFAAALPRTLLSLLEQATADHGLHMVAVVPHFVTGWNRWCRALQAGAWFGQLHDGLLTVAAIEGGQLRAVRALPLPLPQGAAANAIGQDAVSHYWLTQMLQREALLLGLAPPALIQLAGPLPAALARPAGEGHVATQWLEAGQEGGRLGGLSAASRLALAGGPR
ncbi:hypothetical protein IP91_02527 [Pseudoduganella lurida]|uniref:Pilus assembly protein PilM n=1 Tax=Pseudoduganella lurida TaxID=1036180 RepID=A0A562R7T4_9BURK|nr:hypothetical protein [Pseudoduganella lurida]TWI65121.1 hypothetical protein IP91_02527 [Pseudoduganella lurida]